MLSYICILLACSSRFWFWFWSILKLLATILNQLNAVHTQISIRIHTHTHMHCSISYMHMCYISIYVCLLVGIDCRRDSIRWKSGSCSSARALCNRVLSTFVPPPTTHTHTHYSSTVCLAVCTVFVVLLPFCFCWLLTLYY